jgi:hypothetical protein
MCDAGIEIEWRIENQNLIFDSSSSVLSLMYSMCDAGIEIEWRIENQISNQEIDQTPNKKIFFVIVAVFYFYHSQESKASITVYKARMNEHCHER